ncbi:MAG: hypothetical protein VB100_13320 [Angelakisella sp.]|nr:hypothetical protein [Angelakisella sp.]
MKRCYARLCILCGTGSALLMFLSPLFGLAALWVGVGLLIVALSIKYALLRYSFCGHGGAVPQWSKSNTNHCPKCGKPYEYNDK